MKVFESLDTQNSGYLNPEQFFDACEIIYWMKGMTTSTFSFKWWLIIENFLQNKIKLNYVARSNFLAVAMMICVFVNMITIIIPYTNVNEATASRFDTLD